MQYLRRIMSAADRMDRLIRDVLIFSRVRRTEFPLERIELGSFIAGVIESYPGLSVASAEIEVVTPLPPVRANPAALTQCISNLLGNAIKFVAPGEKPKIRIWSLVENERVRLFIRDNGIGIGARNRDKRRSLAAKHPTRKQPLAHRVTPGRPFHALQRALNTLPPLSQYPG